MTTDYKTLTLVNVPGSANPDVDDARFTFDAKIGADANKDGKPDFFEGQKVDPAGIDPAKLLMPSGLTKRATRNFVDSAGVLWRGEYVMTRGDNGKPKSNLVAYEREDGTPMDDNATDGNTFIAPADIGRALRGEEFKGFIAEINGHLKTIADQEKRDGITPEKRGPNVSERVRLYEEYLDKARKLNALSPATYPLPEGVAPAESAAPPVTTATKPPPPVQAEAGSPTAVPETAVVVPPVVPLVVPPAPTAPNSRLPIQESQAVTKDSIKDGDLTVVTEAIAQIRRYEVKALPLDGKGNQLAAVSVKGNRIVNQNGDAKFMSGDDTYTGSTADIFRLHTELLAILRRAAPERYYFGFAGAGTRPITKPATTRAESGTVIFTDVKRDIAKAQGTAELDRLAETLKGTAPVNLAGLKLTSMASATGEKVKDAKGKITKLTSGNLAEFMDTATGLLKPGFTWAESPIPNAANEATAEKGAEAVITYLRSKGVGEEILTALKINTVITGGALKPAATLEFTVKIAATAPSENTAPIATASFTGIPEDRKVALTEFTDVTLKKFFADAKLVESNAKLDFTTKKKYLIGKAAITTDDLQQSFDAAIAANIAHQLMTLLVTLGTTPGAVYLAKVLDKEFPASAVAEGAPISPPPTTPEPAPPIIAGSTSAGATPATSAKITPTGAKSPTSGATASAPPPAKDKDKISFGAKTAFTVGSTAPSVTVNGDISRITSIKSTEPDLGYQQITFSTNGGKLNLDGMVKLSRTVRERGVTADPLETETATNNGGKPYGVRTYKLTVVYADGSSESLSVVADKI